MARSWAAYILPTCLAIGGIWFFVRSDPDARQSAPAAASASARPLGPPIALLDGLREGDALGDWTVQKIYVNRSPEDKPQLAVELDRQGSGVTVWIARKSDAPKAPVTTERYALTHGDPRLYGAPLPSDAFDTTSKAIAERVRRAEATAPLPQGF